MCSDNALAVLEAPYVRGGLLPSDLACLWRVMGAIVANQGLLKTVRPPRRVIALPENPSLQRYDCGHSLWRRCQLQLGRLPSAVSVFIVVADEAVFYRKCTINEALRSASFPRDSFG